MRQIVIPLADGFEEIEATTNIDVLRRAGVEVTTAAVNDNVDQLEVRGDHDIIIEADKNIADVNFEETAGIILPGGMPGAANLRDDQRVIDLVQQLDEAEKLVAAICAAPIALEKAGVLEDRPATSYPGFEDQLSSCIYQQERVVVNKNLVTGRGPGVALEFAVKLVEYLVGPEKAEELKAAMLVNF